LALLGLRQDDDWHEGTHEWKEKMNTKKAPKLDMNDPASMNEEAILASTKTKTQMLFTTIRQPNGWTKEDTDKLSAQWRDLLVTNALEAKTYVIDEHQILFVVDNGEQAIEVKKFSLSRPQTLKITWDRR
jgi:hypothetical protein